ncbi:hypothetical protein HAX54_047028, partial [Datura stramonium]|nr:hypothetical protein [Datura stramonium]
RALMDLERHETMFWVTNESITFEVRKSHLLPIEIRDICVAVVENETGGAEQIFQASPKERKVKFKWMKYYLCGTKGRKWVRKSRPNDNSPGG